MNPLIGEDLLLEITMQADNGFIVLDQNGKVVLWNDWVAKFSGISKQSAINNTLDTIFPALIGSRLFKSIAQCIEMKTSTILSSRFNKSLLPLQIEDGKSEIPQTILLKHLHSDGGTQCLIQIKDDSKAMNRENYLREIHDANILERDRLTESNRRLNKEIKERKALEYALRQAQKELETMAFSDSLTGLSNRNVFRDRIEQAIKLGQRTDEKSGLLLIDLDKFKETNDAFGHDAGDRLLQEVARKLHKCVRTSDTVSRLGGDEFAIILHNISEIQNAEIISRNILETFSEPFLLQGASATISGSIGISIFPDHADTAETLLKYADMAMYEAKKEGTNTFRSFTPEMSNAVSIRKNLEKDIGRALKLNEFRVYYQPIVDLCSGRVKSAEALLRWFHPQRGLIPPAEFIPLAEESRMIIPIGEWVLRTVCEQIKRWEKAGFPPIPVAVNLSARQCQNDELLGITSRILDETGVNPAWLSYEITERAIMSGEDSVDTMFHKVHEMGIGFSVDDFGNGYSSLNYLQRFPIDAIKIDRSFMRNVPGNPDESTLVEAIIAMAQRLKLKIVVEGVETDDQVNFLRSANCDYAQGFYFSRAVPPEEFEKLIQVSLYQILGLDPLSVSPAYSNATANHVSST